MTFIAEAGRIQVTDADGVKKLDTNDDLFHVVGATISGTVNIDQVSLTDGQTRNDTNVFNLGSCHSACTHVIGAVRFSGSQGGAVGFDRWTTYMGGDLIWIFSAPPKFPAANWGTTPQDLMSYRFYVQGSQVRMAQRRILLGGLETSNATFRAHSIQYRLKAGLFT